jgi:hypothetical protein
MSATTTTATTTVETKANPAPENQDHEQDQSKADFYEDIHFLGDKAGKIVIRSPPTFANKLDDRKYQMQHLAAAFRVFAKQGFDEGVAGHISLRDPVNPRKITRTFWTVWTVWTWDVMADIDRSLLDQSVEYALLYDPGIGSRSGR